MFSHFITYGRISEEIREDLEGAFVSNIFSTGKDELVVETRSKKGYFQLILQWMEQEMFIRYNLPYRKFGRKCLPWFKESENLQIESVVQIPYERIIHIKLQNQTSVLLKGFGRYSNVLFYEKDICTQVFRQNLTSDLGESIKNYVGNNLRECEIDNENQFKESYPQLFGPYPQTWYKEY